MKSLDKIEFIFGGSFDPVHIGHQNLVQHLRDICPAWLIRILVCAVPAIKGSTVANFEQRTAMAKLAFSGFENLLIDEREEYRDGRSYTFDSLQEIRQETRQEKEARRLVFVIGADNVTVMKDWHQSTELSNLCHLLIINRPGYELRTVQTAISELGFSEVNNLQGLAKYTVGRYHCLQILEKDISSTNIKIKLASGASIASLVDQSVLEYIKANNIY